jgi:hypothetical protein
MMQGGCFCGFVRYAARGETSFETCCHCSICRRTSGAPFVAWFTVGVADFAFTAGEPARLRSSEHGTRTFCPRCGTPLTFASSRSPAELDVTLCSLDEPERLPPRDHTHASTRLSWVTAGDALPTFPGARS